MLPEGWCWSTIDEICSKVVDGDHNPPPSESLPTKYMMISSKNVLDNRLNDLVDVRYLSKSVFEKCNKRTNLTKGDILLTTVGSLGRSCIYEGEQNLVLQRSVSVLTPLILNDYVKLFFDSGYFQHYIEDNARGTAQKGFYLNLLEATTIPIPPLNEQSRITEKAIRLVSVLKLIDGNTSMMTAWIDKAKTKILELAISGKLVPQDPSEEPAIELLKRINPAFQPSDNLHYEGELPNGWLECRLGELFTVTMGQSPDGKTLNKTDGVEFHQGKICFTDKYLSESFVRTTAPVKYATSNSLLCCVRAPVGVFNITQRTICIGRGLCALTPRSKDLDLDYWFYTLCSYKNYLEARATGTTFKAVSGDIIRNTSVLLPPMFEQRRILNRITSLFFILDQISDSINDAE